MVDAIVASSESVHNSNCKECVNNNNNNRQKTHTNPSIIAMMIKQNVKKTVLQARRRKIESRGWMKSGGRGVDEKWGGWMKSGGVG